MAPRAARISSSPAALRGLADRLGARGARERLDVRDDVAHLRLEAAGLVLGVVTSALSLSVFACVSS